MADAQRLSPGDTGYDPTTDPDSPMYNWISPDTKQSDLPIKFYSPINGAVYSPDYQGPRPTNPDGSTSGAKPPATSGPPHGGDLHDPAYVDQLISYYAGLPGADPSLAANPGYWKQKIMSGELGSDESYIINKMQTAFKDTAGSGNTGVGAYTGITRPDAVASPYNPATWGESYKVPSVADLTNDPGYQADEASVQRGFERGAAAKGTILDGGFVGRTLPRAMQDFTSTAYKNLNDRNFANYQQRYNQFLDTNNLALGARQLNENDYNQDVTNNLNQYLTRYGAYQDLIKNNISYADLGLRATTAGAPK